MPNYMIEFMAGGDPESLTEEVEAETEHMARLRLIARYTHEQPVEIFDAWEVED